MLHLKEEDKQTTMISMFKILKKIIKQYNLFIKMLTKLFSISFASRTLSIQSSSLKTKSTL